jgi:acetyl esterase/lipase
MRSAGFGQLQAVYTSESTSSTNEFYKANILAIAILTIVVAFGALLANKGELALDAHVLRIKDVQYGPNNLQGNNLMDLYFPSTGSGPYPVVVWIHGGGWLIGNKDNSPREVLLDNGIAVASINYRLSKEAIFPAQEEDCFGALQYLRTHARELNIDPNEIGLWGASAGGHLVALVGIKSSIGSPNGTAPVKAICDWCGPADIRTLAAQSKPDCPLHHDTPDAVEKLLLGGTIEEKKTLAVEASPTAFAHGNCPPILIMHGDADDIVPVEQSLDLSKALKSAGAPHVDMVVLPGSGHNFCTRENMERVSKFFVTYLKQSAKRASFEQ